MSYNKDTKMYYGYIYCVTNNLNNSKYIGQTIVNVEDRWKDHKNASKRLNYYFYRAIRFYGVENFDIKELLCVSEKKKTDLLNKLNELEIEYIDIYKTILPNGYNTTAGGKTCAPHSRAIYQYDKLGNLVNSFESIKEAEILTGVHNTCISNVCSGKRKTAKGWIFRYKEDSFDKYSFIHISNKVVNKFTIDGVFIKRYNSISDAAKDTLTNFTSNTSISDVCNGKSITCAGYVFRYEFDEFDKYSVKPPTLKVDQYDLFGNFIKSYDSISKASSDNKIGHVDISFVCKGKIKSAGGYIFRYSNEDFNKYDVSRPDKPVIQYDMDGNYLNRFNSIKKASEYLSVNPSAISRCCVGKSKSTGGFRFAYVDKKLNGDYVNNQLKPVSQYSMSGDLLTKYSTLTEAENITNINKANIQKVCVGKYKSAGGYIWRYSTPEEIQIYKEGENN